MKLPYEQVALEVEKLYNQTQTEGQLNGQCTLISAFLEACGWTEDEYWSERLSREEGLTS